MTNLKKALRDDQKEKPDNKFNHQLFIRSLKGISLRPIAIPSVLGTKSDLLDSNTFLKDRLQSSQRMEDVSRATGIKVADQAQLQQSRDADEDAVIMEESASEYRTFETCKFEYLANNLESKFKSF